MSNDELQFGDTEPVSERKLVQDDQVQEERTMRREHSGRGDRGGPVPQQRDVVEAFFGGSARTQFGGISNKTLNALVEVFESIDTGYDDPGIDPALSRRNFHIHPIDGQTTNPTLVIGLPTRVGNLETVIYYALVLEIPGVQMREVRRYRNDAPLQLPVFSEDRMDKRWEEAVSAAVSRISPATQSYAGYQLIPSNLLVEDTSEGTIREDILAIYTNAVDAICGFRENMANFTGVSIPSVYIGPDFVNDYRHFEATLDYSRKPRFDTSKLPIRSDIAMTVYHVEQPRRDEEGQFVPTRRPIGTVSVAIDMIVSESGEISEWGRRSSSDSTQPFWQTIINITDTVGEQGIPWSLENSLFMIGTTANLSTDFRWVEGLRSRVGTQYKSLEDLANLTLAHPDPSLRGVSEDITPHTSDAELSEYLNFTVSPDVYYGLILSQGSEKGWANQIWERISLSQDSNERAALIKVLYEAADRMTGGEFFKVMNDEGLSLRQSPVSSIDNRVFTGYFTDQDGNLRDIREWNVPAILNLTKDNPADAYSIAMEYQDTMMADAQSELVHDLAERYRILETLLGTNGFHLNGTAEMIQIESWFIRILSTAMVRAGVMPRISDHNGLRVRSHRSSSYRGDAIGRLDITKRRDRDDDFSRRRYRG